LILSSTNETLPIRTASTAALISLSVGNQKSYVFDACRAYGSHGFAHILIGIARQTGVSGYVGDGANRWPSVHTLDAARAYRLALEGAPAGSRLHAVADEGIPFRDIAVGIGRGAGVPVASISAPDAAERFAFLGGSVGVDNPVSSEVTRKVLGWEPEHPGLIEDLEHGHYFGPG